MEWLSGWRRRGEQSRGERRQRKREKLEGCVASSSETEDGGTWEEPSWLTRMLGEEQCNLQPKHSTLPCRWNYDTMGR